MTLRTRYALAVCVACLLAGCTKSTSGMNGAGHGGNDPSTMAGAAMAGTQGSAGSGGSTSAAGGAGKSGLGGSGTDGGAGVAGGSCPANIAIPALCRVCSDGKCGTPACAAGKFTGFVCANGDAGAGAADGGTGTGVCNLACVKGKHCEAKPKATCVDDVPNAGVDAG